MSLAEEKTTFTNDNKDAQNPFQYGSVWLRADFHLHTKADKEFTYKGKDNDFAAKYVERLKAANVGLGVITNHNKFDMAEFKALRKRARRAGIGLLPGVELSVNDGANGVHTLIVFSDDWLEGGQDYINQFLNVAFRGKTPDQYEHENGRSNDDLLDTLKALEGYNRDFFIIFAHVEASSGLWNEIDGGRMKELAENPLIQEYCLGFQKVRTHDKPRAKCRTKVHGWWGEQYPAELEGSDPKKLDEIGRGQAVFLKLGDYNFDAVKYALTDFDFRVANDVPDVAHSHIDSVAFEGGLLNGKSVTFSPHLNCLIGIRGSGKSAILESLRYALEIPFGQQAQDKEYKNELVPYLLKSGGKIIVKATDRHGTRYEIHRILSHAPEVYVDGELRPGVSIRETVVSKPLYFGQKDLSAAGKGFGSDLVEKLVGEDLKPVRVKIDQKIDALESAVDGLLSVQSNVEDKEAKEAELADIDFRLEQFDKYGVRDKLDKQVEFGKDIDFCETIAEMAEDWHSSIEVAVADAKEAFDGLERHHSKYNKVFFKRYNKKLDELTATLKQAEKLESSIEKIESALGELGEELETIKDDFKEEFAEIERELVKALEDQGVTSIQPNAYLELTQRKATLESEIADLKKNTSKRQTKNRAVLAAATALNDAWHEEFKLVSAALDAINAAQPSLQVTGTFKGDKDAFRTKMEDAFRGSKIRKESYQAISQGYIDFGEILKDLDKAATHTKSKAETFKELFFANLFDLLSCQIPNSYEVTYHGKSLRSHSLGQRASAMMLFILSQQDNDLLLIDQPEDDLDSQTVYDEVVKLLREIKPNQQFIFATHNANFPVLGDAETVTSCAAEDEKMAVETATIDSRACQEKIIKIMEGGPEAFERRKTIYQIWKAG